MRDFYALFLLLPHLAVAMLTDLPVIAYPSSKGSLNVNFSGHFYLCDPLERGNISPTVSGGSASYLYSWTKEGDASFQRNTQKISHLLPGIYKVVITDVATGAKLEATQEIYQPISLTVSSTALSSCGDGQDASMTIQVLGGSGQHTLKVNGQPITQTTISQLAAGTYEIQVADQANNCVYTVLETIATKAEAVSITAEVKPVSCIGSNDGVITLAVSGGQAPYHYSWTDGDTAATRTDLIAGTYEVTITDASQCTFSASVTVEEPSHPITVSAVSLSDVSCAGARDGEIKLEITGGQAPYKLTWSDGSVLAQRQGLLPGDYQVTIQDARGCIVTKDFSIASPNRLEATLISDVTYDCTQKRFVAQASVLVTGGSGQYTYLWNNTESSTQPNYTLTSEGALTVKVIDQKGCELVVSQQIDFPEPASADFDFKVKGAFAPQTLISVEDILEFTSKSKGEVISWAWDFGDGHVSNQQDPDHQYQEMGDYQVKLSIQDAYGCSDVKQMTVTVGDTFVFLVPNAFTPNGDGLNDYFSPKMKGVIEYELRIFNKNGDLLYHTNRKDDKGWSGAALGNQTAAGSYIFKAKLTNKQGQQVIKEGSFLLIK
ncbi:PKD domain-containing protein [Penaeicola halotolerans]|uniref:PKD domain-containing protein n=1 Tax=Penaeicola halotolerans TaxID=2793196 RepID=UPI001CF91721|nr:PKD domain-containing protein [Penaeicola halotolerans]